MKHYINNGIGFKKWFRYNHHQYGNPRYYLFAGLLANYYEWAIWKLTKHSFLIPTYFSLFGIVNVQKYAPVLTTCKKGLYGILGDILQDERLAVDCDRHTLFVQDNYCVSKHKLKLCDYGNENLFEFIIKYGKKIQNEFPKELLK